MKNNKAVLPTAVALGVCAFGTWVWPTAWTYDKLAGRTVRTNRFTGSVQYLTLEGWQSSQKQLPTIEPHLSPPSSKPADPTVAQLESVEGKLGFTGVSNSEFGGELYNGSDKPITGNVIFHIIVKSKSKPDLPPGYKPSDVVGGGYSPISTKILADRRIREAVHWPAQHAAYVSINPAWQFDPEHEEFAWNLELPGHRDTYIALPDGRYVQIPEGSPPDKLRALRQKLAEIQSKQPSRTRGQSNNSGRNEAKKIIANFRKKYGHEYDKLSDAEVAEMVYRLFPNEYPELKDYKDKP